MDKKLKKFSTEFKGQDVVPGEGRPIQEQSDISPEEVLHNQRSIDEQRQLQVQEEQ